MKAETPHPSVAAARDNSRAGFVFALVFVLFALFLASQVGSQTSWFRGTPLVQQPAFWPIVAIGGMLLFGGAELLTLWRSRRDASGSLRDELTVWAAAIEYVAWFMAYVWLVPRAGYLPTTLLFCLALTLRLGYRGYRPVLAALLTGVTTVVVFKSLLGVRIPGGAAYEYLPPAIRNFMILYL